MFFKRRANFFSTRSLFCYGLGRFLLRRHDNVFERQALTHLDLHNDLNSGTSKCVSLVLHKRNCRMLLSWNTKNLIEHVDLCFTCERWPSAFTCGQARKQEFERPGSRNCKVDEEIDRRRNASDQSSRSVQGGGLDKPRASTPGARARQGREHARENTHTKLTHNLQRFDMQASVSYVYNHG